MTHVEMERWRSFFRKSKEDIWTIIRQAITVAAVDYPTDFRVRRDEIAETLFDRSLLQGHAKDHPISFEEGEVRGAGPPHMLNAPSDDGDVAVCRQLHDDAEALSDELEEEALILRDINCIKGTLVDADQPESVIMEALQRLQYMQITLENLKATTIGKTVKSLKKHPSRRVQVIARELLRQWKSLVVEWLESAKNVTAVGTSAATGTECVHNLEDGGHGAGLVSPPLDEVALLEATAPDVDLAQLFSFVDGGDTCTGMDGSQIPSNSIESSVKDNLSYSYRSQSESMLTDFSDLSTKASTICPWPEERGSATRDIYPPSGKWDREAVTLKGQASSRGKSQIDVGLQVQKGISEVLGPGRPCNGISKTKHVSGLAKAKPTTDENRMSRSSVLHSSVTTDVSNAEKSCTGVKPANDYNSNRVDKFGTMQVDEKLEVAKRKLHQGYQQAENAKRQRTVQILSSLELPKSIQVEKSKLKSRELPTSGHGGRVRMNAPVHNRELTKSGLVGKARINAPVHNKASMQSI